MNKAVLLLVLALGIFTFSSAQSPSLELIQNSEVVDGILHLDQSCRISLRVNDGLENIDGYVYEIGDIQLLAIDGDETKDLGLFKKRELSYRNGLTFSLRSTKIADLPKHGYFVIKSVSRFNPQNEETKLNIPDNQMIIRFINDQI